MALEYTSLMGEIEQILSQPKPVHFKWRAELITSDGERLQVHKILGLEIDRNYVANYADEMYVEMMLGSGQYAHRVYPSRDNLILTLYQEPIGEVDKTRADGVEIKVQQFRCVLLDANSSVMEGNAQSTANEQTMDLSSFKRLRVQLVDLTVEQVRFITVGTTLHNKPPGDHLRFLLTYLSKQVQIDNVLAIEGVDMYRADNAEPYRQIVLPHGTPMTDLAAILQNSAGIYATDIGQYLQHRRWYVYPLYDHTRFDSSLKTLTLINVPPNRFPGVERTYRTTARQIIAMVTGRVKHMDVGAQGFANEGNGVRFADPRRMFKAFTVSGDDNKANVLRNQLNNELRTVDVRTGMNNIPIASKRITANKFVQLSELASRNGSYVVCMWENSLMEAIYPGMPMKYLYEVQGQVIETTGVVLNANHRVSSTTPGSFNGGYKCDTVLLIYTNRKLDWVEGETA